MIAVTLAPPDLEADAVQDLVRPEALMDVAEDDNGLGVASHARGEP